jgi:hypothetical protein
MVSRLGPDSPKRQTITVHVHETMNAGWEVERTWARKVRGRKMVKNGEKMVLDKTLMTGSGFQRRTTSSSIM